MVEDGTVTLGQALVDCDETIRLQSELIMALKVDNENLRMLLAERLPMTRKGYMNPSNAMEMFPTADQAITAALGDLANLRGA